MLLYWPLLLGMHIQTCRFYSDEERFVGSWVYIPTCLPVARDEDGGSLPLCFLLCTRKDEDLCNWIYVVILILLQWLLFCTVVLWVIQGVALNAGVLPFSKGRALQNWSSIWAEIWRINRLFGEKYKELELENSWQCRSTPKTSNLWIKTTKNSTNQEIKIWGNFGAIFWIFEIYGGNHKQE
jgi:hypothetical protein